MTAWTEWFMLIDWLGKGRSMKIVIRCGIIFSFVILFLSCTQMPTGVQWDEGMRGMARAFEDLMPYIYNSKRFADPENKMFIKTKLEQLNHYSHSLDEHMARGLSGQDPLFDAGLRGLKRNIERASESYFVESYDYAQQILQNTANYCVECHTRTNVGRSFAFYDQFANQAHLKIEKMDLAKAYVATRQFAPAIQTLLAVVEDEQSTSEETMGALKRALTLMIRNQNDLKQALKVVQGQNKNARLDSKRSVLLAWEKDLKQLIAKPQKLSLKRILQEQKSRSMGESTYALDLAESFVLHQQLNVIKDPTQRANIFVALGHIYQSHDSLGFWDLPDHYYEACILQLPHTDLAKKCYFDLESRINSQYRSRGDSTLPRAEQNHLLKLKSLTLKKGSPGISGQSDF